MASHRTDSRRKTLVARLLAVVGLAGAAGVAFMPGVSFSPKPVDIETLGALAPVTGQDEGPTGVDAGQLTNAGLLLASMAVEPTIPPEAEFDPTPVLAPEDVPGGPGDEGAEGEDPRAEAAPARYRFLGVIKSPDGPMAFISDEEADGGPRQRLVGQGRDLDGLTVASVKSDHVMLRDSSDRLSRVELAAQTTMWPTAAPPPARATPNRSAGRRDNSAASPTKTIGGMDRQSLQMRNELLAGRIDAEEAQILHQKGVFDDATMRQYERLQEQRERRTAAKDAARRRGGSTGKEK